MSTDSPRSCTFIAYGSTELSQNLNALIVQQWLWYIPCWALFPGVGDHFPPHNPLSNGSVRCPKHCSVCFPITYKTSFFSGLCASVEHVISTVKPLQLGMIGAPALLRYSIFRVMQITHFPSPPFAYTVKNLKSALNSSSKSLN